MREGYFFMFKRFQNNIIYFFSKENFDKQHQAKT